MEEKPDLTDAGILRYELLKKSLLLDHKIRVDRIALKNTRYFKGEEKLPLLVAYDYKLRRYIRLWANPRWPPLKEGKAYKIAMGLSAKSRPAILIKEVCFNKQTNQWEDL